MPRGTVLFDHFLPFGTVPVDHFLPLGTLLENVFKKRLLKGLFIFLLKVSLTTFIVYSLLTRYSFASRLLISNKKLLPFNSNFSLLILYFGDPYGNRTHDSTLRGWRLSRLTNGPYKLKCLLFLLFTFSTLLFISFLFDFVKTNFTLFLNFI